MVNMTKTATSQLLNLLKRFFQNFLRYGEYSLRSNSYNTLFYFEIHLMRYTSWKIIFDLKLVRVIKDFPKLVQLDQK